MFSHVTLGTNNIEAALAYYDAVLAPLGHSRFYTAAGAGAYGKEDNSQFWIVSPFDGAAAGAGNGTHIAFLAPSRHAVDEFHKIALSLGGKDEGAPGLRPHYHPHYYGAYVRDPDGNKLQAVCHQLEKGGAE